MSVFQTVSSIDDLERLDAKLSKIKVNDDVFYVVHELAQNVVQGNERAQVTIYRNKIIFIIYTDKSAKIIEAWEKAKKSVQLDSFGLSSFGLPTVIKNADIQVSQGKRTVRIEAVVGAA